MLIARCTSRLCSMIFPDVTGGFSSVVNVPLVQSEDDTAPPAEQPKVTVQQEPKKAPARTQTQGRTEGRTEATRTRPGVKRTALPGEDGYEEFDSEPALPTPPLAQPQATPTDDGAKPTRRCSPRCTQHSTPPG